MVARTSDQVPSKTTLITRFLSNPIALVIYGVVTALYAVALIGNLLGQVAAITFTGIGFLALSYFYATVQQNERFLAAFPGQVRFNRVLIHHNVNEHGDTQVYYSFEGQNLSNSPRRNLDFTVWSPGSIQLSDTVNGSIDGRSTLWKAITTTSTTKGKISNRIDVEFDFMDLCGPRQRLPVYTFSLPIEGAFKDAFSSSSSWTHRPMVLTDELVFEIETTATCSITDAWESSVDFWGEADNSEMQRLKSTNYIKTIGDHKIRWVIEKPIPTDEYALNFKLSAVGK